MIHTFLSILIAESIYLDSHLIASWHPDVVEDDNDDDDDGDDEHGGGGGGCGVK